MGAFDTLRNFFGLSTSKNTIGQKTIAMGTSPAPGDKIKGFKSKLIQFPPDLAQTFNFWLQDHTDTKSELTKRLGRYKDLSYMYYNNTTVSTAIDLYADETVQYDSQSQVLNIETESKDFTNFIQDFFDSVGIDSGFLRDTAKNLALYGDSFTINTTKEKEGIVAITPVDVGSILDRLEFNVNQIRRKNSIGIGRGEGVIQINLAQVVSKSEYLQDLIGIIDQEGDSKNDEFNPSDFFKSYLFGFILNTELYGLSAGKPMVVPPWNVSHYRLDSSESEFAPFGRPLLINAISVFRQLKAAENLMTLARVYKFPRDKFTIKAGPEMAEADIYEAVNEARQEYHNLTDQYGNKEAMSMNREVWVNEGVFDHEQIESRLDLDQIADVEYLRENVIMGTCIPRGYLIVDSGGFGNVGTGLLQQYKPFARKVYVLQTEILRELTSLIKIHCVLTNKHVDEEFELTMNFPIIEDSSDRVRMRQDSLSLSKEIIASFAEVSGMDRDQALPTPVVKDILSKYSFLSNDEIIEWTKEIEKMRSEKMSEATLSESKRKMLEDTLKDSNIVNKILFDSKSKLNMREGIIQNGHYFSSKNISPIQREMIENMQKLITKRQRI